MSEINQLDDPVDHRIAHGNQGIDAAQGHPIDKLL